MEFQPTAKNLYCPFCVEVMTLEEKKSSDPINAVDNIQGLIAMMKKNALDNQMFQSDHFNAEVYMHYLIPRVKEIEKYDLNGALSALEQGMLFVCAELSKEKDTVYIVNAGRMNHGKSSLLNSILGRNEFKVNDIRETVSNKIVKFKPGVFLIDTPGLSADSNDDKEAFNIYAKANCILFVHNPRIGELHSEEIAYIRKLKELFPKDYLASHMVLVLTFMEEFEQKQLELIRNKICELVKKNLGIDNLRIFEVSNSRYLKYINESSPAKKEAFLKASGIPELNNYINENIPLWKRDNMLLKQNILNKCRKECVEAFNDVSHKADSRVKELSSKLTEVKENERRLLGTLNELEKKLSKLISMKRELESIKSDWQNERSNY